MKIKNILLLAVTMASLAFTALASDTVTGYAAKPMLLNGPLTILTTATATLATNQAVIVPVKHDRGISVMPTFAGASGTSVSNMVFNFSVTLDGTNWSTISTNLSYSAPLNAVATCQPYFLIPPTVLDNAKAVKLLSVINPSAVTVNVTAVQYAYFFNP